MIEEPLRGMEWMRLAKSIQVCYQGFMNKRLALSLRMRRPDRGSSRKG